MTTIQESLADITAIDYTTLLDSGAGPYGLTDAGFVPKPVGRLISEQLALAKQLFGADVDLGPGSVIRRIVELTAVEHARSYAMLAGVVDNQTVPTARGQALDRLGEELGLPRPFLQAAGEVSLTLKGALPAGVTGVTLPVGARMLSLGGHHAALTASILLTDTQRSLTITVEAFFAGPEHNISAALPAQTLSAWNPLDTALAEVQSVMTARGDAVLEDVVEIKHTAPLQGGQLRWPDDRYRQLLLRAPRSIWSREAIAIAVSLVPGVRQMKLIDSYGGLDVQKSIFGNFNFGERVFGTERDLSSPYMFTVLVAPTAAAVWQGPDGLAANISEAIEDLRPIGIFPDIRQAVEVGVGVMARIVVDGIPLPSGSSATVNSSVAAQALKARLMERVRAYIEGLPFGETVSPAKVSWALMNEPGIADVQDLRLTSYPIAVADVDFADPGNSGGVQSLNCGESLRTGEDQIAVYIDDADDLTII